MSANENKILDVSIYVFPKTLKWKVRSTLDVGAIMPEAKEGPGVETTTWAFLLLLRHRKSYDQLPHTSDHHALFMMFPIPS